MHLVLRLPALTLILLAAAVGVAAPPDNYGKAVATGRYTFPSGYIDRLTLLAKTSDAKIDREPRSAASVFLKAAREALNEPMAFTAGISKRTAPAKQRNLGPEDFRFNARPATVPLFQLLPPLPEAEKTTW